MPLAHHVRTRPEGQTFFPDRTTKSNVLVSCKGHYFDRNAFFAVLEANASIEWSAVDHPAAQLLFTPAMASHFDCYVLYDMPGIEFQSTGDRLPIFHEPPDFYKQGLLAMLEQGFPLVILHHACAAWPAWPTWAEIVGGQFLYRPMHSRGSLKPDSGYRLDVRHRVSPSQQHPVAGGIEPFELQDELYLFEVFDDSIVPLFTSDFSFVRDNFYSAHNALQGELNSRAQWEHPAGSNLVGWVKNYLNSPIVYLQFGDGPSTYASPSFRKILNNAIHWCSSADARKWARERHQQFRASV